MRSLVGCHAGIRYGFVVHHAARFVVRDATRFTVRRHGVTKTHSRPHTSSDNPYSEAQFKTLKYRPDFPGRFSSMLEARAFCRTFFPWYNGSHRHSGIGFMTPEAMHYGRAEAIDLSRRETLAAAYVAHPERFVRKPPVPPEIPTGRLDQQARVEGGGRYSVIRSGIRLTMVDRFRTSQDTPRVVSRRCRS